MGNYHGVAAHAPPRNLNNCKPEPPSTVCPLTDVKPDFLCTTDESCLPFGPDYVCRVVKQDQAARRTGDMQFEPAVRKAGLSAGGVRRDHL